MAKGQLVCPDMGASTPATYLANVMIAPKHENQKKKNNSGSVKLDANDLEALANSRRPTDGDTPIFVTAKQMLLVKRSAFKPGTYHKDRLCSVVAHTEMVATRLREAFARELKPCKRCAKEWQCK